MTMPCRTTQHCAYHGFCHRCAPPELDKIASQINEAIQRNDPDENHWGPLYTAVVAVLRTGIPAILKDRNDRLAQAEGLRISEKSGACNNCGSLPSMWCTHCASCPDGCYGGHKHTDPCPEAPE